MHIVNRGLFVLAASSLVPAAAMGAVIEVGTSDDIEATINTLVPGDELILQGGTYTLTERFSFNIAGTSAQPILIRAKDGEVPHLHRPGAGENIIDIDDASYVTLRGIEFSGGSAGIRISGADGTADHLTIEDCHIHDTADVALRANDPATVYDSFVFRNNHIHDTDGTGEGMYLGCNVNGCQFANAIIEGNYVHHTNAASVVQGDGIEIKEGSYNNVVRDNVIHDTKYPCILTYSTVGNGAPNVIERNLMWNCGNHGIQSAADATIRNNIILSAVDDGIAMQPHQTGAPSNLIVVHNTIFNDTHDAVSVRDMTGSVVLANNALYASSRYSIYVQNATVDLTAASNVGVGTVSGVTGGWTVGAIATDLVGGSYNGAPPIDAFPASGGALVGAGDPAHGAADDFNGTARGASTDVGAYAFDSSGNPGWVLAAEAKPIVGSGGTGGTGGAGGTSGTSGTAGTGGSGGAGGTSGMSGTAGAAGSGGGAGTAGAAGGSGSGGGGTAGTGGVGGVGGVGGGVAGSGGSGGSPSGCHSTSSGPGIAGLWALAALLWTRRRPSELKAP